MLQQQIWKKLITDKLSVRKVENLVRRAKKKLSVKEPSESQKPFYLVDAENKLQEKFGTKVRINMSKKGGKIEVEFYSEEELDRILEIMSVL